MWLIVQIAIVLAMMGSIVFSRLFGSLLLGLSGLAAVCAGGMSLFSPQAAIYQIPSGFPAITWQFQLDSLSGFFLIIVGLIVVSVSFYIPGYLRADEQKCATGKMMFFTGLFIIGMYLVLLANEVCTFMLAWELMSVASYFLVIYHNEQASNRTAAFVYLLMAQASGLFILFGYSVLIHFASGFDFKALQAAHLSATATLLAFIFAFIGFGMKAGIIPLHVWLPRAHPVAPSHISALMSGVMLKIAVYGFIRFSFVLLGHLSWQLGVLVLLFGTASALLGVLYALMQHDLKRLLAYHSVENIGIIFIGLGLAIIFLDTGHPLLGALGLTAALYHSLNHAVFKSLLFLGAGTVIQQTGEHDLEKMGGLIHKMPYTATFFLIGCISISALPPLNGFVSEWLTFQAALSVAVLKSAILRTLVPVSAALLALTGALAAACFVKVYGISFLGFARSESVTKVRDPDWCMRIAMGFLALLCVLLGLLPGSVINLINPITRMLTGTELTASLHHGLWLIPMSQRTASYSAAVVMIGLIVSIAFIYVLSYFSARKKMKATKVRPWDCGFGNLSRETQYSATAFAMPLRRVFKNTWPIEEKLQITDAKLQYHLKVSDWFWDYGYEPLEQWVLKVARFLARIQGGNVRIYLAYTFFSLLLLLWVVA